MPVGASGRIVIEIDPDLKHELYASLKGDGSSLKEWFLENVDQYLSNKEHQLDLLNNNNFMEESSGV